MIGWLHGQVLHHHKSGALVLDVHGAVRARDAADEVGATVGELPAPSFSKRGEAAPEPVAAAKPAPAPAPAPSMPPTQPPKPITREAGYEFPPVEAPAAAATAPPQPAATPAPAPAPAPNAPAFGFPSEPPPAFVPGLPFGAPTPPDVAPLQERPAAQPVIPPAATPPFGAPFAMPGFEPPAPWAWEPPEGGGDEPKEPTP